MSNEYIEKFQNYDKLVHDDIYTSKRGNTNILFIGSCRCYVYSIYFEEICKHVPWFENAQFGFSAIGVHIIDLLKRQKTQNITNVIENADIIICEQIRNYSFLNTSEKCEQNIFNNFNIKKSCKIVQIPNLEFRYYANELIFGNKNDIHDYNIVKVIKEKNLEKFIHHCKKYNFDIFGEYVSNNINCIRLFATFNHPCDNTVLEAIKLIIKNEFHQELLEPILNILRKIEIFCPDINSVDICNADYECGLNMY